MVVGMGVGREQYWLLWNGGSGSLKVFVAEGSS